MKRSINSEDSTKTSVNKKSTCDGNTFVWHNVVSENLNCCMTMLYTKNEADQLFTEIEDSVEYNTGVLAKVRMYGKWINIPRKQTAFGDEGMTYSFSGNTVPAKPWPAFLLKVKRRIELALSDKWIFNFVLINRYNDGKDHIGEHRDDEKDLNRSAPIASLSLGQERDFVFRHKDTRGRQKSRSDLKPISVKLKSGCLFIMNPPTNDFWYHSLPIRRTALSSRINLTFRVMVEK